MNNTNFTLFACPPSAPPPLAPPPTEDWAAQVPPSFWVAFTMMAFFSLVGSIQSGTILYRACCRRRRLSPDTLAALSNLKDRRRKEALRAPDDDL